jgi:acetoin utilization deacetylase AcuC-like enzyme
MGITAIRRIYDHIHPRNNTAIAQCKKILLSQFPYMTSHEANEIFEEVINPKNKKFKYILLIAEKRNQEVFGIAIASFFSKSNFFHLDYIATDHSKNTGGVGGALYERLREEALESKSLGIFFDCLPDERELCYEDQDYKQNVSRLKFYEKYGARPIINTSFELPRSDNSVFYLVYDSIGINEKLKKEQLKKIIKVMLEQKQKTKCDSSYITKVLNSVKDEHAARRKPRYLKNNKPLSVTFSIHSDRKISLIINEEHNIHHVKERGYLESPIRVSSIRKELDRLPFLEKVKSKSFPEKHLEEVHDIEYLKFLKKICEHIGESSTLYGDIFPIRNSTRMPKSLESQIGYYCIDTSTPLNANAYKAARLSVDCAITGAELIAGGKQIAYALVRPPGHHAEKKHFGGFCYLNSTAIAAHYLSKQGKVAILDIDYHHGNGQQNIFYDRKDVLTVSIHADPDYAYPYFSGFQDEVGHKEGIGFNINMPLKENTDGKSFHKALELALKKISEFSPEYLVIALGLDIAKNDPSGTWELVPEDFEKNGQLIAKLNLPTLVVQEGGYKNKFLGTNARSFFEGLWSGFYLK